MRRRGTVLCATVLLAAGMGLPGAGAARADEGAGAGSAGGAGGDARVVVEQRFTASDGVELQTTLTGTGAVADKPTVVEFTPYGDAGQSLGVGDDYNFLLVQIRGTGDSDGSFDALGPLTQRDVVEVLAWACQQPFSNGHLAVTGFSASAITLYNSWHTELPCVDAAILRSGTHELYRDLLVPGGVTNLLPGAGVIAMIGAPAVLQGADRLQRNPASAFDVLAGLVSSGVSAGFAHPNLDDWWAERGWRGDANDIPALILNGFYDVESRGAFEAYRALRADGAHLVMEGGHDGTPTGTDGGQGEADAWLDHYLRGIDNGIEDAPRVSLVLAKGSRASYLAGDHVRVEASDWPVPGTTWTELALRADNTMTTAVPASQVTRSYLSLPSIPTMTDVPNIALLEEAGLKALTGALPLLTQADLAVVEGVTGRTLRTAPLAHDVDLAGPLALDLRLATTTPGSAIWAVLSDVAPDGTANPLTVGRLSTNFPGVITEKSLTDGQGRIVQPYGDYTRPVPARSGKYRDYQVELWPVGNRFRAGHRIQVQLLGASLASPLALPALHSIKFGAEGGARLRVPVLPGSDLASAID